MLHSILKKQILKTDLNTAWQFISHPGNLEKITPPEMNFFVIGDIKDKKMYAGQIIEYYVNPFKGVNTYWVTEITHVKEKEFFVDEQRFGPYAFWHHQHILKQTANGIEMTDIIHYKLPFGWIGRLVNNLIVKKKLERIFDYRREKLDDLFNIPSFVKQAV